MKNIRWWQVADFTLMFFRLAISEKILSRLGLGIERVGEPQIMNASKVQTLGKKIEADLLELFGSPLLTVSDLKKALNYSSTASIHQSISKKTFPIKVFNMPNRREKFALTSDVASYLAEQALKSEHQKGEEK